MFSDFLLDFPCARESFGEHNVVAFAELNVSFFCMDYGFALQNEACFLQETTPTEQETYPYINLLINMKNNGYSDYSIKTTKTLLKHLNEHTGLANPEAVKAYVANLKKRDGTEVTKAYKRGLIQAYARYCKFKKIQWEKPTYRPEETSIQPPTEEKIKMLISASQKLLSLKLQISYETGLRPVELTGNRGLMVKDIHVDNQTITPTSAKGCNARPPIKISKELTALLNLYILKNNMKPTQRLFTTSPTKYGDYFRRVRARVAQKTGDQSFLTIRLYDLRHAYATRQLRRTQNAEKVRIIMGHKRLNTTQRYLHLLDLDNDKWECEFATNKEEAKKLIEANFTYVTTTPDGTMLFKQPK